jgi:hypothetical protein
LIAVGLAIIGAVLLEPSVRQVAAGWSGGGAASDEWPQTDVFTGVVMVKQIKYQTHMLGERGPLCRRGMPRGGQRADRTFEVPTERCVEEPVHEFHVSAHRANLRTNRLLTLLSECSGRIGEIAGCGGMARRAGARQSWATTTGRPQLCRGC